MFGEMSLNTISFIIPCYQTAKPLLIRCLQSVRNLHSGWEWEIILVDDGSPNSKIPEWLEELEYKDKIRYFYQENSGQGAARNLGLQKAKGAYVHFLDSDDYLLPESFCECLKLTEQYELDILLFEYKIVDGVDSICDKKQKYALQLTDGVDYLMRKNILGVVCNVVVRRDLLEGLWFSSRIVHEDEEYAPKMLVRAKKLLVTSIKAYAYYQRPSSTMHKQDEAHLEKRMSDFRVVIHNLANYAVTLEENRQKAIMRRVHHLQEALLYVMLKTAPDYRVFKRWLLLMEQEGFYPLCRCKYELKYRFFCWATDSKWKLRLLYNIFSWK